MSPHLRFATIGVHHASLLAASKASTTKTTGSPFSLVFIVIIIGAVYFLIMRPQRNRAKQARQLQASIELGDEVMLTSGIIGRVTWIEGDRARVEISPNTEIEVVRRALGQKVSAPIADVAVAADPAEESDDAVKLPYGQGSGQADDSSSASIDSLLHSPSSSEQDDKEGT
jgi:preprotein translocase subunit YajC